ncbi:hypothetical protein HDU97_006348 [Phlyctochytrium planicorne]|nr:hypothetical protein HDU97_006348 [Phlyctochytrium planicorne]
MEGNETTGLNADNSTELYEESEADDWFTTISIPYTWVLNSLSVLCGLISIAIFVLCKRRSNALLQRVSLQIVYLIVFVQMGLHLSYLYSMIFTDNENCKASVVLYVSFSLLRAFLTTCIGIHAFILQVMRRNFKENALLIYTTLSLSISLLFSVSLLSIGIIDYTELYGCWFENSNAAPYVFYYGPLNVAICANAICAVLLLWHLRNTPEDLLKRRKEKPVETSDPRLNLLAAESQTETDSFRMFLPFGCEFFDSTLAVFTPNAESPVLSFLGVTFTSLGGVFLFLVVIFDPTIFRILSGKDKAQPAATEYTGKKEMSTKGSLHSIFAGA